MRSTVCVKIAVALIACILFVSGCEQADENEVLYETTVEPLRLSWWGTDVRHRYTLLGAKLFEENNPGVQVKCEYSVWDGFERRNRIAMVSRTAADVMLINYNWLDAYSRDGEGYYDIYELKDIVDLSQFDKTDLKSGERNGKLNGLPLAYNATVFFYNAELYDQYGLDIPKTWDDLFEAAKVMRKDNIYPLGMVKKHFFLAMVAYFEQTSGKHFFTNDGKLNVTEEDMQEILKFYNRLIDEKVICPIGQFTINDFLKKNTAGIACWINDGMKYGRDLEENGCTMVCGDMIEANDSKLYGWYRKPSTLYAISKNTENPEAAAELLEFLVNNEDMAKLQGVEKGFPVSKKALAVTEKSVDSPEYARCANEMLLNSKAKFENMNTELENPDVIKSFQAGTDRYIYGKQSLEDCAAQLVKEIRAAVED
ncbi:MAG: ABC transporter substrate-binding protein [Lachnospiraceae bacterium]|nr:ABC transporter substrate-binding protein [Lachnospiraceae bacterium]